MDWNEIADQYRSGATLRELATRTGVSYQTVRRRLTALGVETRGNTKTEKWRQDKAAAMTKYHLSRDDVEPLADGTRSVAEIASLLEVPDEVLRLRMIEWGIDRLAAQARPDRNYFWDGGIHVDREGYLLISMPEHPYRNRHNQVRMHRLVVEHRIGRHLSPSEVVDHIDGDTSNNCDDNLRLYPNNADHLRATLTGSTNLTPEGREWKRLQAVRRAYLRADAIRQVSGNDAGRFPLSLDRQWWSQSIGGPDL